MFLIINVLLLIRECLLVNKYFDNYKLEDHLGKFFLDTIFLI